MATFSFCFVPSKQNHAIPVRCSTSVLHAHKQLIIGCGLPSCQKFKSNHSPSRINSFTLPQYSEVF